MMWVHTVQALRRTNQRPPLHQTVGVTLRQLGSGTEMTVRHILITADRLRQHIRRLMFAKLALLVFGIIMLRWASAPLPIISHAPPIAHLVEMSDTVPLDSTAVRTLGLNTRVGMEVLDQRAEIVFDD